ncbi:hypothetical protein [Phytohabitans houttuyneae]|uniref:Uncharacterized protein n=1 Tax=Phytohabitans houttuyneae TaxID=1076126 RepID=A0A6V8KEU8_9ACTN|nr:hypothetical protein [Phytohabitans houttuyneae]GFJ83732.1 hypothetical protein Phou_079120 [Phytohabitans houttuyneae]
MFAAFEPAPLVDLAAGHVLARLAGYGLALVPYWPYTFERPDAASDVVVVTNWRPDGPARAFVEPSDAHTMPGTVDVEPGPGHPYWVIETTGFKAVWPLGSRDGRALVFTAQSREPGAAAARRGLGWMLGLV